MPEPAAINRGPGRGTARTAAAVASLAVAGCAWGQVYVGSNGDPGQPGAGVVLSNFPSEAAPTLLIPAPQPPAPIDRATSSAAAPAVSSAAPNPAGLGRLIADVAGDVGISPLLVHAVIAAESNFDPLARSPKGALGLMQLMPATAAMFGVSRPFDARENVHAGAQYLRWLAERLDQRIDLVLAAYNAGLGSVVKAGYRVPDFPETRSYVRRVLDRVACSRADECRPNPTRPA